MSDGEPGRMTDPPLSAPKIRFCNNGDEVRRGLRRYDAVLSENFIRRRFAS
jgi:hypothetical protein